MVIFLVGTGYASMSTFTLSIEKNGYRAFFTPLVVALGIVSYFNLGGHALDQFVVLVALSLFYIVGINQGNIVEQGWIKAQRHALELQSLMDSFPGGILVYSHGKVLRANAYFKVLFAGDTSQQVEPDHILDRLKESPAFVRNLNRFEDDEHLKRTDFEAPIQLSSGKRMFWLHFVRAEETSRKEPEVIVVAQDVQAKVDADNQIESQRQKLETSSKLAALGEMAGGVAHEINNPIFVITSRIQLLLLQLDKGSETEKKFRPHFEAILETCDRIVKIVRGLKYLSRNSDNEPFEKISLCSLINQASDLCALRASQTGIRLEVGPLPHDCTIEARPVQLSQVILNLLNNALDAVEKLDSPWVRIDVECGPSEFQISITDSGHGIPKEVSERMMEPFFTTKPPDKGTGLGLSISHGIVRSHHGTLVLDESALHTRFVVRLPRVQHQRSLA
jgi:signal transduction histidine kinase